MCAADQGRVKGLTRQCSLATESRIIKPLHTQLGFLHCWGDGGIINPPSEGRNIRGGFWHSATQRSEEPMVLKWRRKRWFLPPLYHRSPALSLDLGNRGPTIGPMVYRAHSGPPLLQSPSSPHQGRGLWGQRDIPIQKPGHLLGHAPGIWEPGIPCSKTLHLLPGPTCSPSPCPSS